MRGVRNLIPVILLVALAGGLPPAGATSPGGNGPVVFARGGDLWRLDPGSTTPVNLTGTGEVYEDRPSISPDGGRIAYERYPVPDPWVTTTPGSRIWVMAMDGSGQSSITDAIDTQLVDAATPTWSPDGSLIAFDASPPSSVDTERQIWVAKADGSGGAAVTPPGQFWAEPAWSPVSMELAVLYEHSDIVVLDLATGQDRLVIDGFDLGWESPSDPDWAPDGSSLVMQCGTSNICAIDADGTDLRDVEGRADLMSNSPAYSPDGTQVVAATTDDSGHFQIVTMPVEGAEAGVTWLTQGVQPATHPAWGPGPGGPPTPPPPPDDGGDPPAPEPGRATTFDGDPATTERIDLAPPTTAAIGISQLYFDDGAATHVVLSRDDTFADSLAGTSLVFDGPLLMTRTSHLTASTRAEIQRVLPPGGVVYLLGGPTAIAPAVEAMLAADGFEVVRLAGPSRVETALAVADEAAALYGFMDVMVARAYGAAGNETSGWADSVAAGGMAAMTGVPILLTPTESVHPALAAWLAESPPARTFLLGGTAALSPAVEAAMPGEVHRLAGPDRTATAVAIATDLWGVDPDGEGAYVIINGVRPDGWAYGLAASLIAAVHEAPVLMVTDSVPAAIAPLVGACGLAVNDLVLVGDATVIPPAIEAELDELDGGLC